MDTVVPRVMVLAGPNGAGKTTSSRSLLVDALKTLTFVNADVIAQGMSGFDPESVAMQAGRIMLKRLHELADARASFAFETTLSAKHYAGWLKKLKESGYAVELYFFWLANADMAVARVALRVQRGGHHVPEETIRRRYRGSAQNFLKLYKPICTKWELYDNSHSNNPILAAFGDDQGHETILNHEFWSKIKEEGESNA